MALECAQIMAENCRGGKVDSYNQISRYTKKKDTCVRGRGGRVDILRDTKRRDRVHVGESSITVIAFKNRPTRFVLS